jgi:hypothetical protein
MASAQYPAQPGAPEPACSSPSKERTFCSGKFTKSSYTKPSETNIEADQRAPLHLQIPSLYCLKSHIELS